MDSAWPLELTGEAQSPTALIVLVEELTKPGRRDVRGKSRTRPAVPVDPVKGAPVDMSPCRRRQRHHLTTSKAASMKAGIEHL
jgi:hypothetical protein